MARILIVDDEPNVVYSFRKGLASPAVEVFDAETGAEAIRFVEESPPDVVVLDVRLPDVSGLEVFQRIRAVDRRLPVIVVTAHTTTETAIDAMKLGAFEYLVKPVDIHQLRSLVARAVELSRWQHQPATFTEDGSATLADLIVGQSPAMHEVYKAIGRVAEEDLSVLILGESGTGKELVARALYHHGRRADRPFLPVNCAALPESLLESELFGHERGAFTGADRRRIGKFEQAHGGTLFLDEVGDTSPSTQAKLLRVLQDGRFERVGGRETIAVDVRVVAATNQDLDAKIASGAFRGDLMFRLNEFTIRIPPLRERPQDLPLLVEHFLRRFEEGDDVPGVAPETMRALEAHDWPGNVRELQSVLRFARLHAVGNAITPDCLPGNCRDAHANEELPDVARLVRHLLQGDEDDVYRQVLACVERVTLREALQGAGGNQVHASRRLGISRTTLRSKLATLDVEPEDREAV